MTTPLSRGLWPSLVCLLVMSLLLCSMIRGSRARVRFVGGESSSFGVTARRLRVSNAGTVPIRFSKIGLYQMYDDAQNHRGDVFASSQRKLSLEYSRGGSATPIRGPNATAGNALTRFLQCAGMRCAARGSGIDDHSDVFDSLSQDNYVLLQPDTALVVEWVDDVSFRVVRLGAFASTGSNDPSLCRLRLETLSGPSSSTSSETATPLFLTFQSGDTQSSTFLKADGSHIAPNGIYATSTVSFADAQAKETLMLQSSIKRFSYTRAQGIANARNAQPVYSPDYPNHNIYRIQEIPMMQKPNFLFSMTVDSQGEYKLPNNGTVILAQIMVNVGDRGDPSIVYENGAIYATEQWGAQTTRSIEMIAGGAFEVSYLNDQTSDSAYLRVVAVGSNAKNEAPAKCAGVWATGSDDTGKLHVMVHKCVTQASFLWSDDAISLPTSSTPCVLSV